MVTEANTNVQENVEEAVNDTTVNEKWEDDIAIRSLKEGDKFDTSFFGTRMRMSTVIYITLLLAFLTFFLPFTTEAPLTRGTTGKNYADIGWYKNTRSPLHWSNAYSASGFDVVFGKSVDYKESYGVKNVRIPSNDDINLTGFYQKDSKLYLNFGSLWGVVIPLLFVFAAIILASKEQWNNGGGFTRAALLGLLAILMYGYMYFYLCGGFWEMFVEKTIKVSSRAPIMADVFMHLGIGFWLGIGFTILSIVLCFIAKAKVKSGKKPYVSAKDKKAYEEATGKSFDTTEA